MAEHAAMQHVPVSLSGEERRMLHERHLPIEDQVEIGGRSLRVVRWVASPGQTAAPLLFFSGIGGNAELLAPFHETLGGRDILTFDMPGIGGSSPAGGPYRPSTIASLAAKILDRYGYDKVDVMGFSWGGIIAQQFAAAYPKRTSHLVLAATSPGMTMVPGKPSALMFMLNPRKFSDPGFLRRHFDTIYGGSGQGWDDYYQGVRKPTPAGYFYQLLSLWGWSGLLLLHRVKAPTLILAGDDDNLIPRANAHILEALIPDARIRWIEGGHMFLLTHLEESAGMLRDFLQPAAQASPQAGAEASAVV
jgi:poly(3-hydroxyalkanoate) depolymerase